MKNNSTKPARSANVAGVSQTHDNCRLSTNRGPGPGSSEGSTVPITRVHGKERMLIEQIVDALHDIDIDQLPPTPRADTIRGLLWALEPLLAPKIEARQRHHVPFNARLSQSEAKIGRAAIEEVWRISCILLVGLHFLRPHGYVSRCGVEVPGGWYPGDFHNAIQEAREVLERLERLNDQLYTLRHGALPDAQT